MKFPIGVIIQAFLSISLLILLATISPGPDFALITKNSLLYSRKHGVYCALGISISLLILLWFSSLACLLTHRYVKTHLNRIQCYIVKAMGAVLVAFGVRIATLQQTLV